MKISKSKLATRILLISTLTISVVSLVNFAEQRNLENKQNRNYLAVVKSYGNETITKRSDENLIAIGRKTCELLGDGVTSNKVIEVIVKASSLGEDPEALGHLLRNSLKLMCPQYAYIIAAG